MNNLISRPINHVFEAIAGLFYKITNVINKGPNKTINQSNFLTILPHVNSITRLVIKKKFVTSCEQTKCKIWIIKQIELWVTKKGQLFFDHLKFLLFISTSIVVKWCQIRIRSMFWIRLPISISSFLFLSRFFLSLFSLKKTMGEGGKIWNLDLPV